MTDYPISDYDDAYANGAYIAGAAEIPPRWADTARQFRERLLQSGRARIDLEYGRGPRRLLDLLLPEGPPAGLVTFVHGGYWKAFDKSFWSHLAAGPLAHGHAVAMPSYTLCPQARIADIAVDIAAAVGLAAQEVSGPIRLSGHSAGGQLVTRLISGEPLLASPVLERVAGVTSISGVHDLRPLMLTGMNDILKIDAGEAGFQSPALLQPLTSVPVTVWVGADERPEFLRQSRVFHDMWRGFQTPMAMVEETGRHHFNVIDGLADPEHQLCRTLLGLSG